MSNEPLSQREVDQLRLDVMVQMLIRRVKHKDKSNVVRHLRFPRPRLDAYIMRKGNPPPNVVDKRMHAQEITGSIPHELRFPWEKGLRLELDVGDIPPVVERAVRDLLNLHKDRSLSDDAFREVRHHLLQLVGRQMKKIMGADFKGEPLKAQDLVDLKNYEDAVALKHAKEKVKAAAERVRILPRLPGYIHPDRIKYQG